MFFQANSVLGFEGVPAHHHNHQNHKGEISVESQKWFRLQKNHTVYMTKGSYFKLSIVNQLMVKMKCPISDL